MASLGHVAVGLAAARIYQNGRVPRASSMAFWSALSLLPDLDVIGFSLGVDYGDPWGHRGATHSLALSVSLGVALGLAARLAGRPAVRTAIAASVVLASHALLDTMTDGGLGCALLWPFDFTRFFAPWRPIPVAPIGLDFASPHGGMVVLAELLLFGPVLLLALRSPPLVTRNTSFFLPLWLISVLLISQSHAMRDAIVGFLLGEDTAFTPGFSEAAFQSVAYGQSEVEVRHLLGPPFREVWFYTPEDARPPDERPALPLQKCLVVGFESGAVTMLHDPESCKAISLGAGRTALEVTEQLGPPFESCWQYSWSPRGRPYRERLVCFANTKVRFIIRKWH